MANEAVVLIKQAFARNKILLSADISLTFAMVNFLELSLQALPFLFTLRKRIQLDAANKHLMQANGYYQKKSDQLTTCDKFEMLTINNELNRHSLLLSSCHNELAEVIQRFFKAIPRLSTQVINSSFALDIQNLINNLSSKHETLTNSLSNEQLKSPKYLADIKQLSAIIQQKTARLYLQTNKLYLSFNKHNNNQAAQLIPARQIEALAVYVNLVKRRITVGNNANATVAYFGQFYQADELDQQLADFSKQICGYVKFMAAEYSLELETYFSKEYRLALRQIQIYLVYKNWHSYLQRLGSTQSQSLADKINRSNLLIVERNKQFLYFGSSGSNTDLIVLQLHRFVCQASSNDNNCHPSNVLAVIDAEIKKLKMKIDKRSAELTDADCLVSIGTVALNIMTCNLYVSISTLGISTLDEVLPGQRLSARYMQFFTGIAATTLLSADIYSSQWFGFSYQFTMCLSDLILADISTIINLLKLIGFDEIDSVNHLSSIKYVVMLLVNTAIYCSLLGLTIENMSLFSIGFIMANLCRSLIGEMTDVISHKINQSSQSYAPYQFFKYTLQSCGFFAGKYLVDLAYAYLTRINPPKFNDLLRNKELCLAHEDACHVAAFAALDLDGDVDSRQLARAFRQQALQHHPDKNPVNIEKFVELSNAKKILEDVFSRKTGASLQTNTGRNNPY